MKMRIFSILMAVTISLSLLACGSNNADESVTGISETEAGQYETTTENESTETTEVITEDSTETPAPAEMETNAILPLSYEDFNVNEFGYSNYVDLYGAGNGYEDVERISIMSANCTDYTEYPAQMSSDTTTSRGIKLGDSREQVIAAYGDSKNEVVYKAKGYNHDGLESQYNLCYSYIDERYPEVFFNLSFSMDQNDNVLNICYEAILMKWYK